MTVPAVLYDVVGGGGDGTLDEFTDVVTGPTTDSVTHDFDAGDGLADTVTTPDSDTTDNAPTVSEDLAATMGGALLATLEGWWHAPTYSGSGNFLNSGTMGSAWDFALGAGGAAPTFSTDKFVFDGTDDYMSIADADSLDLAAGENLTIGVILTPGVGFSAAGRLISKEPSGSPFWILRGSASNVCLSTGDGTQTNTVTGQTMVASTKMMAAGVADRRLVVPSLRTATAYRSAGGTLNTGTPTAYTSYAAINSTAAVVLGAGGSPLANFMKMDLHGAFMTKKALAPADLQAIAAYYGV